VFRAAIRSWVLTLAVALPALTGAQSALAADSPSGSEAAAGHSFPLAAEVLEPAAGDPAVDVVTSGTLDRRFRPFVSRGSHFLIKPFWFRLPPLTGAQPAGNGALAVLLARAGMDQSVEVFVRRGGESLPLTRQGVIPQWGGAQDTVFLLPPGLSSGEPLYAHVVRLGRAATDLHFAASTLEGTLAEANAHARIIAFTFGALIAMALSTLLVRFVLGEALCTLYGTVFALQALYIAYFSGQGFQWPLLSLARPLSSYAWNIPVALSAAASALFLREFANLRLFSQKTYEAFGWLAVAFVALALANLLRAVPGLSPFIAGAGNLLFLGSALFTVAITFLAWRSGNRAAGWFLIAWLLLSTFQVLTALQLLFARADDAGSLLYYGLAPSMVAAAVLIALGASDRVRAQSEALNEAKRHALTDPLTGVLNRRSLIERLDAACLRAKPLSSPVAVLFIDLDHFKQINDTYGHAAGDACLTGIITPIHAELRQTDVIGRYGGEEFVVILSGADGASACQIAERICSRVAEVSIEGFGPPIHLTCSIGVAASDTLGVWGQHLIALADTAQYAAKRAGRNRVQLATALAA
jgi:two-component system, sensor histidine kinase LadS